MLDIFNNPLIKNAALGKLKSICEEKGVTLVAIRYDKDKEDFDFELYTGINHIVPEQDMAQYKQALLKQLQGE